MPVATLANAFSKASGRRSKASAPTMVGVDIGCHSVKIVQFEAGIRSTRPRVCRIVPHTTPLTTLDPFQSLDEIEQTLNRSWSSRNRWWPLPAACVLSMSLMTFRSLELAHSDREANLPDPWRDAFFAEPDIQPGSWVVEGWPSQVEVPPRGSPSFAAIGIEQEFASAIVAQLWRCGLDCRVLDGLPFAMARTVTGKSESGPIAVIDWGYSAMTLTIVVDNRPCFTRILRDCELRVLTAAIMRTLDLDAEQCRQILETYGFGRPASGQESNDMSAILSEIAAPYLSRLSEELRRTWLFLQHLSGQTPVKTVLMGGGAALKSSAAIVQGSIPVPTETWSMLSGATSGHRSDAASAVFGPAMALASLTRNS